jgi:hypothetical protein
MSARLVLIEWVDSAQPVPGWAWLEGSTRGDVVKCRSVGWLVHDSADVKALAPNRATMCGADQVSGVIRIPTRCVTKIKTLR